MINLSSANALNLGQSIILSFGKELNQVTCCTSTECNLIQIFHCQGLCFCRTLWNPNLKLHIIIPKERAEEMNDLRDNTEIPLKVG